MIILVHIYDLDDRILDTNVFFNSDSKKAETMADLWIVKHSAYHSDMFLKAEKVYCDGRGHKYLNADNTYTI